MKAATQQNRFTAARDRACASHRQRRLPVTPVPVWVDGASTRKTGVSSDIDPVPECDSQGDPCESNIPRVLLIDQDTESAEALSALLMPEAHVIHAATLAEAQHLLRRDLFALVVVDPALPDGNAVTLLPLIVATPVLVYAEREPSWRQPATAFLPKPWTSPRRLWSTISSLLGVPANMSAGD